MDAPADWGDQSGLHSKRKVAQFRASAGVQGVLEREILILALGKKADSDGGRPTNVPKHHPRDRVMKDGFSERTALRQCTLFPKLQVQRQPPGTGCVSWDLA